MVTGGSAAFMAVGELRDLERHVGMGGLGAVVVPAVSRFVMEVPFPFRIIQDGIEEGPESVRVSSWFDLAPL